MRFPFPGGCNLFHGSFNTVCCRPKLITVQEYLAAISFRLRCCCNYTLLSQLKIYNGYRRAPLVADCPDFAAAPAFYV